MRKDAGETIAFHETIASWYNDGGNTACGFHAFYGVANKSLPCGTKVVFRNGSREVTATVDDRGPFVGGRTWDLNQNTAAALGFGGVGSVLVQPLAGRRVPHRRHALSAVRSSPGYVCRAS